MRHIIYARVRNLRRNPRYLILMLVLPIVFTAVFGGMGAGQGKALIPVVDEDQTGPSAKLVEELQYTGSFAVGITNREDLVTLVRENEAEFGLIILRGFGDSLAAGEIPQVELVQVKESLLAMSFIGVLRSSLQRVAFNAHIVEASLDVLTREAPITGDRATALQDRVYRLTAEKWRDALPVQVAGRVFDTAKSFPYDPTAHASLGFALFFSSYTIIFAVGEILEDRRQGVWNRLMISPLSKFQIYLGNLAYAFVTGFLSIFFLVLVRRFVFGVDWGNNLPGVLLVIAAYTFTTAALGLLLSSVVRTPQQLQSVVPIVVTSSSMIGGLYWPLEIVSSRTLLFISKFLPQTWAMNALKDLVVYQKGPEAVMLPIAILLLMGVLFLGTGLQLRESQP